jgi:hypothetical protein
MSKLNSSHPWGYHWYYKDRSHHLQPEPAELTLEEVCPIWHEKFRNGLNERDRSILSRDSKNCLVGEAWGFSGRQAGYYIAPLIPLIGCWSCVKYGRKFGKIAKKKESSSANKDFEPIISEFLGHWNQKHKNITKKNKKTRIN